jgi:peptide/nickel transport system substrate-binding protein
LRRAGRIVGALILALAAGCQSDSPPARDSRDVPPSPTVQKAQVATRQRLVTAIISDPKTFNPLINTDQTTATVFGNLFDTLVRINPRTTEIQPALAVSWEYNSEGTECTFHLRDGVRWHDGQPFGADDVVFTFRALSDRRVPNDLTDLLVVDGEPAEVDKIDALTIRITLPHPFAPLLSALTAVPIIPAHILARSVEGGDFAQQWGIDTPSERLIGTGPYRMTQFVPGQSIQYVRNHDYWMHDEHGTQLPYLEERTILIVPSQEAMFRKFLAGETDIHNARPEEVAELRRRSKELNIHVQEIGVDTGALFVTFNRNPRYYERNGRKKPRFNWFTDKLFLRAIAHSVDRHFIVKSCMDGFGQAAVAHISPANEFYHDRDLDPDEYDLNLARRLLAEGGYADRNGNGILEDRDGNEVEFRLNTNSGNKTRECMCAILTRDWTTLGMKVHNLPLDTSVVVDKLEHTFDWDAFLIGSTGVLEPNNGASLLRSSGNLHLWNPNQSSPATEWEAAIDGLLERGARELDPAKRRPIYLRIQEILHEELPMIETARQTQFVAYKNTLENFEPTVWGPYRPERIRFSR